MATANMHKPPTPRIIDFARQRLRELKTQAQIIQGELEMWQQLLNRHPVCIACGGYGVRPSSAPDNNNGKLRECKTCGGTGEP